MKLCCPKDEQILTTSMLLESKSLETLKLPDSLLIKDDILVEDYFDFMDSVVTKYGSLTNYDLTEHILARANPWIIDTLQNTDYYRMKVRDSFVYDQRRMIALPKGNYIKIPDAVNYNEILSVFENTFIDVNIPEYKLRIYEYAILKHEFTVRVGKDEKKFLEMSGRVQDLKTKTGRGTIVGHIKNPRYVNPVNNQEYFSTKRDDGNTTKLPRIPFIVTKINGLQNGQLIHPTTNPNTLGKAYSNGCIGVKEYDAWLIYYHAPLNTKIKIRYDLDIINRKGDTILLKDIYRKRIDID